MSCANVSRFANAHVEIDFDVILQLVERTSMIGLPMTNFVRSTPRRRMCMLRSSYSCELQGQLEKIFEERSVREEASSLPGHATSVVLGLSPTPYGDGLAADEDTMAIMSSLIGVLQDFVRPIRMIQALRKQRGPYRNLKRQIDDIYNQHIERRDRSELLAPEIPLIPHSSKTTRLGSPLTSKISYHTRLNLQSLPN